MSDVNLENKHYITYMIVKDISTQIYQEIMIY